MTNTTIFIEPDLKQRYSGGNLYNRMILDNLSTRRSVHTIKLPVDSDRVTLASFGSINDNLVIDYILTDKISLAGETRQITFIVHGPTLPNPLNDANLTNTPRLVFTSPFLADDFKKAYPNYHDLEVIEPALDHFQSFIKPYTPNKGQFTCVGAIHPHKAQHLLLSALASLKTYDWKLHLIGHQYPESAYSISIKLFIEKNKLQNKIVFHDELEYHGIADILAKSQLYISCAPFESFGLAIKEAMAMGVPIVNCSDGAPRHYISDDTGWQLAPNCPMLLAEFIRHFLEGKKVLKTKKVKTPSRLSWHLQSDRWNQLIEKTS